LTSLFINLLNYFWPTPLITQIKSIEVFKMNNQTRCNLTFLYPYIIDAPVWGPHRNVAITFWCGKIEWCGYRAVKNIWWYVYSFRHNTRTRRTDAGRTDRRTPYTAVARQKCDGQRAV